MKFVIDGRSIEVSRAATDALDIVASSANPGGATFTVRRNGRLQTGHLCRTAEGYRLWMCGRLFDVTKPLPTVAAATTQPEEGTGPLTAPYACRLLAVHVTAGQPVTTGTPLFRIESMKMEHQVTARGTGIVAEIRAAAGTALAKGDVVMVVHPPANETNTPPRSSATPDLMGAIHTLLVEKKVIDPELRLTPDMRLTEDVGIDSLAMVRLVGTVRERFGIQISARDMNQENFATIGTLIAYLQRKLAQG